MEQPARYGGADCLDSALDMPLEGGCCSSAPPESAFLQTWLWLMALNLSYQQCRSRTIAWAIRIVVTGYLFDLFAKGSSVRSLAGDAPIIGRYK
jgi:hypothetical protein